jgi:hypothetical protein
LVLLTGSTVLAHDDLSLKADDFPAAPASVLGFGDRAWAREAIQQALIGSVDDLHAAAVKAALDQLFVQVNAQAPGQESLALAHALSESCIRTFTGMKISSAGVGPKPLRTLPKIGEIHPPMLSVPADDLPPHAGVLSACYAHRARQWTVAISLVTDSAMLWRQTYVLDEWDIASLGDLPILNQRVLQFAEDSLGQRIGNGECWTLTAEALKAASARPAQAYNFGRELQSGQSVLPGDIIHFRSAVFETGQSTLTMGQPDHTAIVREVSSDSICTLLQQNPGPVNAVEVDFDNLKSGSYTSYRPLAR